MIMGDRQDDSKTNFTYWYTYNACDSHSMAGMILGDCWDTPANLEQVNQFNSTNYHICTKEAGTYHGVF